MTTPLQIVLGTGASPEVARLRSRVIRQYDPLPRLVGGDKVDVDVTLVGQSGATDPTSGSGSLRILVTATDGSTLAALTEFSSSASVWSGQLNLSTIEMGAYLGTDETVPVNLLVQQAIDAGEWRTWAYLGTIVLRDAAASFDTPTPVESFYTASEVDALLAPYSADIVSLQTDLSSLSVDLASVSTDLASLSGSVAESAASLEIVEADVERALYGIGHLRGFFQRAFQNWTSTTPAAPVSVISMGDSLGARIASPLFYKLAGVYGYSLSSAFQNFGPIYTGGPNGFAGPTLAVSNGAVLHRVSDGNPDYTRWPTGTVIEVPAGGVAQWPHASPFGIADRLDIFYVQEPGAGTLLVETSTNGSSWTSQGTIDADGVLAGAVYTVTITSGRYYLRVVGQTGTVNVLWSGARRNGIRGYQCANIAEGGWSLANANTCPAAIVTPIMAHLNPCLITFLMDDSAALFEANFPTLKATLSAGAPNASWIVFGNGPKSVANGGDAASQAQCDWIRSQVDTLGIAFVDMMQLLKSYDALSALGWEGDGVHLSEQAYWFVASRTLRELDVLPVTGRVFDAEAFTPSILTREITVHQNPQGSGPVANPAGVFGTDTTFGSDMSLKLSRSFFIQNAGATSTPFVFTTNDLVHANTLPGRIYFPNSSGALPAPYTNPTSGGVLVISSNKPRWRDEAENIERPFLLYADTDTTAYAASVDIAFTEDFRRQTISLTGDITLTGSGYALGRTREIRLVADGTARTLSFPASWKFVTGPAPTQLGADQVGVLQLVCWGANESDVAAMWHAASDSKTSYVATVSDATATAVSDTLIWRATITKGSGQTTILTLTDPPAPNTTGGQSARITAVGATGGSTVSVRGNISGVPTTLVNLLSTGQGNIGVDAAWTGTGWTILRAIQPCDDHDAFLVASRNLADVPTPATARANLGIVSATESAEGLIEISTEIEAARQNDQLRALTGKSHSAAHSSRLAIPLTATTSNNTQTRAVNGGSVTAGLNGWATNRLSCGTSAGGEGCAGHTVRFPTSTRSGFWGRRIEMSGIWWPTNNFVADTICRAYFRKAIVSATVAPNAGDLSLDSFGFSAENVGGTQYIRLEAYASSTLKTPVEFTSGFDTFGTSFSDWKWRLVKETDGTLTLWINNVLVGSSAAGFAPASGDLSVSSFVTGSEVYVTGSPIASMGFDVNAPVINISGD